MREIILNNDKFFSGHFSLKNNLEIKFFLKYNLETKYSKSHKFK